MGWSSRLRLEMMTMMMNNSGEPRDCQMCLFQSLDKRIPSWSIAVSPCFRPSSPNFWRCHPINQALTAGEMPSCISTRPEVRSPQEPRGAVHIAHQTYGWPQSMMAGRSRWKWCTKIDRIYWRLWKMSVWRMIQKPWLFWWNLSPFRPIWDVILPWSSMANTSRIYVNIDPMVPAVHQSQASTALSARTRLWSHWE